MKKRANLVRSEINVGDIIQIPLSNINVVKVVCKYLTLIVVEKKEFKKAPLMCRLVNKVFQLDKLHGAGSLSILRNIDPKTLNLNRVDMIY